jgi:YidC/Oxa1 family membrane protein insertase
LDNSRLVIALLITLAFIFLYEKLIEWKYPQLAQQSRQASPTATPAEEAAPAPGGPATATIATNGAPERTVTIDTDLFEAVLSSRGCRIKSFTLKQYREAVGPQSPLYQMIRGGDRLPLGMIVTRGGTSIDDGAVDYTTTAPAQIKVAKGNPVTVTFSGKSSDGFKLTKTFTFRDGTYLFDLTAEAEEAKGQPPTGVGLELSQSLSELGGYRDFPQVQVDVQGQTLNEMEKQVEKGVKPVSGKIAYAGFGDRYFLAVFMPLDPAVGTVVMNYQRGEADAEMLFTGAARVESRVYMGPKALDVLEAIDPALRNAINFGWTGIVALPFLRVLKFFYRYAPNYGVAIILLTIGVRLVTLPMSIRGQRSMMKMQRLQPQVQKIRDKHKDDQERLNKEMVDLYKRNHVNPLGGCLPMAVQLPVFYGLYEALLNAIELRHAPFVGWINDLSAPDCLPIAGFTLPFTELHGIPVLVILMTATTFLQQWLTPRNPDPNQQKMMMYMPLMFSVIFLQMPAGLTLYYFASNLLGVIQQVILNREFQQYTPVTTTT